jgi:hypothetical protein
MKKRRSYTDSLANAFYNWTFDNVAALIDSYADEYRADVGLPETRLSDDEIWKLIRKAQLDCNAMRRFLRLAQQCVRQIADGTLTPEQARELSGSDDDLDSRFPTSSKEDNDP